MRSIRRVVSVLLILSVLGVLVWRPSPPPGTADPAPTPTVAARRTVPSVTFRRPAPTAVRPPEVAAPRVDAAGEPVSAAPPVVEQRAPPTVIPMSELPPDALAALGSTARARLGELVDACAHHATVPLDLVCLLEVDDEGLLVLEVQPTVLDAEQIEVDPQAVLPAALVDCLDDALWDQDWRGAIGGIAPGTAVALALSMDLRPEPTTAQGDL